ncbi:hypothetical protein ACXR2T_03775 [Leucobacter sp. HY1910]
MMHRYKPRTLAAAALTCAAALFLLPGCSIVSNVTDLFGDKSAESSEGPRNSAKKPSEQSSTSEQEDAKQAAEERKQKTEDAQREAEEAKKAEEAKRARLVLPSACDAMNSTAYDEATAAIANLNLTVPIQQARLDSFEFTAGEVAKATMQKAVRFESCSYPVYFHNAVVQYVIEIAAADQASLISALRDDPTITEKSSGSVVHFTFDQYYEGQRGAPMSTRVNYIFMGNAWIALFDNGELDYAPAAIEGLRAANPTL